MNLPKMTLSHADSRDISEKNFVLQLQLPSNRDYSEGMQIEKLLRNKKGRD
jgi:hypothetical protein